ncbi:MAG: hypothetical protein EHM43_06225 [Ignavibacteriae bacterium]|nr:MAG: hypothetical protein EHM43_06225 [Ignavibacteriota bacterium]
MFRSLAVAAGFATLVLTGSIELVSQTWTPVVGNRAIYSLCVNPKDPRVVYAGNLARLCLRSNDGGATWQDLEIGSWGGNSQIMLMAVHPVDTSIIFAGGQGLDGLSRSTDGGLTWNTVLKSPDASRLEVAGSSALAFHPTAPDTVYAVKFSNGQLFRSADKGATWDTLSTIPGLAGTDRIRAITVCPDSANVIIASGRRAYMHRSTDGGHTWTSATVSYSVHPDVDIANFVWSPSIPGTVYATAQRSLYQNSPGAGLFRSTDHGLTWASWRFVDTSLYALNVHATKNGDEIFVGGNQVLFPPDSGRIKGDSIVLRNPNGGEMWQDLSDAPWMMNERGDMGVNVWAFAVTERGGLPVLLMATDGGIYTSTNITKVETYPSTTSQPKVTIWSDGESLFLNDVVNADDGPMQYMITDIQGRVTDRGSVTAQPLSIRHLEHGTYLVVCTSTTGQRTFLFQR